MAESEAILTNSVYDDVVWGSDLNWQNHVQLCGENWYHFGLSILYPTPMSILMARASPLLTTFCCLLALYPWCLTVELLREGIISLDTAPSG